jgi:hypothetical protein
MGKKELKMSLRDEGMAQVVEQLSSKFKALRSTPSTAKDEPKTLSFGC